MREEGFEPPTASV